MKYALIILSFSLIISVAAEEESRVCEAEKVYIEEFDSAFGQPGYVDPDYTDVELIFDQENVVSLTIGGLDFSQRKGDQLTFTQYSVAVKTVALTTRKGRQYTYTINNIKGCGYLKRGNEDGGEIIAITNCVPFLGTNRCSRQPDLTNPRIGITN